MWAAGCGRVVVDADASAGVFDQLVALVRLRLVPLVSRACDGARFVDGLPGMGCASKNDEHRWQGNEQSLRVHDVVLPLRYGLSRVNLGSVGGPGLISN